MWNPCTGEAETGGFPGARWPASLAYLLKF